MSSLLEEISDLKKTLDLLKQEKENLITHFELYVQEQLSTVKKLVESLEQGKGLVDQLKVQENNYLSTFSTYAEKVNLVFKQNSEKVDALMKEKCLLEAKILGESEEASVLQYKW